MTALTVAVISDPHFFVRTEQKTASYSHLPVDADGEIDPESRGSHKNPLEDLHALISEQGLKADILICAGDITTYANVTALKAGWKFLDQTAKKLEAALFCAATGNHDVDSRSKKDRSDTFVRDAANFTGLVERLKLLQPAYPAIYYDDDISPVNYRELRKSYFGENFLLLERHDNYRLMIFNSCSEHGHDVNEFGRGTTPESTLQCVRETVKDINEQRINILVVHHPLSPQSGDGDLYSYQAGGDQLLRELEAVNDDWLVINGHKHVGELKNGPSESGVGMTLFSAASFSGTSGAGSEAASNQFYLIDLERSATGQLLGSFRTWNWNLGAKWTRARQVSKAGIYDGCGFGSGMSPIQISDAIAQCFASGIERWSDICIAEPKLKYVLPQSMRAACLLLQSRHGLVVDDEDGFFDKVSRVP